MNIQIQVLAVDWDDKCENYLIFDATGNLDFRAIQSKVGRGTTKLVNHPFAVYGFDGDAIHFRARFRNLPGFICGFPSYLQKMRIRKDLEKYCVWEIEFTALVPLNSHLETLVEYSDDNPVYLEPKDERIMTMRGLASSREKQVLEQDALKTKLGTDIVFRAYCPKCSPKYNGQRVVVRYDPRQHGSRLICCEKDAQGQYNCNSYCS